MTKQRRDEDGKFATGPVSPPPTPEWADQVISEAESLDNPVDRYNHMVAALRKLVDEPAVAGINIEDYATVVVHADDPAPIANAQNHMPNKLAVRYGEHDPNREIVHFGWDGNSNSIYQYRDQKHLPDWQRTYIIKHRVDTPPVQEAKCPSCGEALDSQEHVTACDIVTLTKQRHREGKPVGSTKAEVDARNDGRVTEVELDAREAAMTAPRRRPGPTASAAARVPDGTLQEGDVLTLHADADGQPVTFQYKVVTRKPKTVVIRMIRMDGTLASPETFRVQTHSAAATEYIKLNRYQSLYAPTE